MTTNMSQLTSDPWSKAEVAGERRNSALYAIRFARERFDDVANRVGGIVWEAEADGTTLSFVSDQVTHILGYKPKECRAEGFWSQCIHPDDRARVISARTDAAADNSEHMLEYRIIANDGRVLWFQDAFKLVGIAPCRLLRGILTDITQRRCAEEALQFADSLFEYCSDGVTITDGECRIQRVNAALSDITGYHPDELRGQTPRMFRSGVQDDGFYRAMWTSLEQRGHWRGELWNRRKCGELYIQQLSIVRVLNSNGEIVNYLGVARDVSRSKAAEEQIEQLAHFDALTGLPNRARLMTDLRESINGAHDVQRHFAVLAVDLDRLAHINDTLGHHVGDQLLVAVAGRLQKLVCEAGSVSRHIGDEFTVVLDDIARPEDAADLAERVLAELARAFDLNGHDVVVSACIGISLFPQDGDTPEMLIKHADVALHDAKMVGANRHRFFREEMRAGAVQRSRLEVQRFRLEIALRQALQRHELQLYYQPQVELATGRVTGVEALVRWSHPEMGFISPGEFIPVAEKTGGIVEIGLWVTEQACMAAQAWHGMGHTELRVAVNVSAHQLVDDSFTSHIRQILHRTGLQPHHLELELTESMIMQRPERVIGILNDLRSIGVQFSIDDFGTGYSSLSQLKRFPIDKLKIDQSFTRDIGVDDSGEAITRTVIALGRSMGLCLIAEGVETDAQRRFLKENGCDGIQGYLVSRPVPNRALTALLDAHVTEPNRMAG